MLQNASQTTAFLQATHPIAGPVEHSHYFFTRDEILSFSTLLQKPHQHFIEMHDRTHLAQVLSFIREEYPHISLSLTTDTAYKQPVADFFANHLTTRYALSSTLNDNIKTCLQEAVMNAIIHGNLLVKGHYHDTAHFKEFLELVSTRIANPNLSFKRVCVFVWITHAHITLCVTDEGTGFTLDQQLTSTALESPYGRGLPLIKRMCAAVWQTTPNTLYMQFLRHI